jgi:hypothetical protein
LIKKVLKKKDTTESFEENLDVFLGILYIRRTTVNLNQLGMQLVLPIILDGMYKDDESSKTRLLDRLKVNGYINIINNKDVHISDKGVLFLVEEGGYTRKRKFQLIDEEIKTKTLNKFRWDKIAIIISLISLAISIAFAYHMW